MNNMPKSRMKHSSRGNVGFTLECRLSYTNKTICKSSAFLILNSPSIAKLLVFQHIQGVLRARHNGKTMEEALRTGSG